MEDKPAESSSASPNVHQPLPAKKMNNAGEQVDLNKEAPPDLIKNLLDTDVESKVCEKKKFNEKCINVQPSKSVTPAYDPKPPGVLTHLSHSGDPRERRKRKVVRGMFCLGWIVCCPCFVLGKCLREPPNAEDPEDDLDDPCLPWKYQIDRVPEEPEEEEEEKL